MVSPIDGFPLNRRARMVYLLAPSVLGGPCSYLYGVMGWVVGPAEVPSTDLPPSACAFFVTLPVLVSTYGFYALWFTESFNYKAVV